MEQYHFFLTNNGKRSLEFDWYVKQIKYTYGCIRIYPGKCIDIEIPISFIFNDHPSLDLYEFDPMELLSPRMIDWQKAGLLGISLSYPRQPPTKAKHIANMLYDE